MGVTIVFGGQLGSEGKGKAVWYWASKLNARAVIRVGGSNSGHTTYDEHGNKLALRSLSSGTSVSNCMTIIPSGGFVDLESMLKEIYENNITPDKLKIDYRSVLILRKHKKIENDSGLRSRLASTLSGTGAALIDRIDNPATVQRSETVPEFKPFICDALELQNKLLSEGENLIIEGTQGYGLSVDYKYYPFCTSRNTSAAGFLAEAGLSPFTVDNVVMVIRSFPIRVGGNSGPMYKEITWEDVTHESGADELLQEYTTVTKTLRRIGRFDVDMVRDAIICNRPNIIMMNHVDYIDYKNKNNTILSDKQENFIHDIECKIGQHINYAGNGEMLFIER